MASKTVLRQHLTCALLEGFCVMLSDQGAGDDDPQFAAICQRVSAVCGVAVKVIKADPGGELTHKDIERVKQAIQIFRANTFIDRLFSPEDPIAMMLCLLTDQLAKIKNAAKKAAFEAMLEETENLMVWADPDYCYNKIEPYDAAVVFAELKI